MAGWWARSADERRRDWTARGVPGDFVAAPGDGPAGGRLRETFAREVYGVAPVGRPNDFEAKRIRSSEGDDGVRATFSGPGGAGGFELGLHLPRADGPAPAFLLLSHRGNPVGRLDEEAPGFCPPDLVTERGFALVVLRLQDLDEDRDDGHRGGVHGVFGRPDADAAWGTIAAWAWGASRVLDALADAVPEVDPARVAVVGHSRGGKTALWAAATDPRFALGVSNNSGCSGAAPARGARGETVRQINEGFPHWFAPNYRRHNADPATLPVDQHQLLGLLAPRRLYVASATEDAWADPEGEWLATLAAGAAWTGEGDAIPWDAPLAPGGAVHAGRVGYHLRPGRHALERWDWIRYLDFAATRI